MQITVQIESNTFNLHGFFYSNLFYSILISRKNGLFGAHRPYIAFVDHKHALQVKFVFWSR